ncbi:MAG: hypothetical protein IKD72_03330 [Clostridia bacterium]|nr:hypothetical protein [Clostridia bacterium]
MKVTCEYCGAYVEVTEPAVCPNCAASLAGPIEKAKLDARAQIEKAAAIEKERRDADYEDRLLETLGAVALAAVGGSVAGGKSGFLGRLLRRLIGIHGGRKR